MKPEKEIYATLGSNGRTHHPSNIGSINQLPYSFNHHTTHAALFTPSGHQTSHSSFAASPGSASGDKLFNTILSPYRARKHVSSTPQRLNKIPWQLFSSTESVSLTTLIGQQQHYRRQVNSSPYSLLVNHVELSVQLKDWNWICTNSIESHSEFARSQDPSPGRDYILSEDDGDDEAIVERDIDESNKNLGFDGATVPPLRRQNSGYLCPQCHRWFRSRRSLIRHISNVHRSLQPHICNNRFGRRDLLVRHQRTARYCGNPQLM